MPGKGLFMGNLLHKTNDWRQYISILTCVNREIDCNIGIPEGGGPP